MSADQAYSPEPPEAPTGGAVPSDLPILPDAPAMEPPPMERRTPVLTMPYAAPRKRSLGRRVVGLLVPTVILGGIVGMSWYAYEQYRDADDPAPPSREQLLDSGLDQPD